MEDCTFVCIFEDVSLNGFIWLVDFDRCSHMRLWWQANLPDLMSLIFNQRRRSLNHPSIHLVLKLSIFQLFGVISLVIKGHIAKTKVFMQ
jgi:hypothetical protein